ncbi:MAG: hypothetical protein PHZ04_04115 [Patescibacteria group bacterium]|nr:hypothetical protein [Patescibacteria group bacterium]MDD5554019.1 hypothetical protein [Patescibacteria group bacterium]
MKKISIIIFVAVLFFTVFAGQICLTQAADDNATGLEKAAAGLKDTTEVGFGKVPTQTDVPSLIGSLIGAGLSFIGILFFVLVIYGGYLWMTARGNEEQVGTAISIVTQAAIGLIIVATAYLITRFLGETILNKVL